jgi:hypothetical protein
MTYTSMVLDASRAAERRRSPAPRWAWPDEPVHEGRRDRAI